MDTCPEYIKQCKKAEEIQEAWKPHAWDYVFCQEDDEVVVLSGYETDGGFYGHQKNGEFLSYPARIKGCSHGWKEGHIWLPRQDQLQEMLLPDPNAKDAWGEPYEHDNKADFVFWLFLRFLESLQERKYSQQSGEQLWLRYVMQECYNKVWSTEESEWVSQSEKHTG